MVILGQARQAVISTSLWTRYKFLGLQVENNIF
jgi:hypothetical protein